YYVDEEIALAGEGAEQIVYPQAARKPIKFGFHIYDIRSGRSNSVDIPHTGIHERDSDVLLFQAWLRDGRFVVTDATRMTDVFIVNPQSGTTRRIATGNSALEFVQITASPDSTFVLSTRGDGKHGGIVKVDLGTGEIIPVSPEGSFAEYQWPRI